MPTYLLPAILKALNQIVNVNAFRRRGNLRVTVLL